MRAAIRGRRQAIPFDKQCLHMGVLLKPEVRFHKTRRWRFDWADVALKIAVEVQGGVWIAGRHSRGAGQIKDMEKLNEAQAMGWRVIQVTPQQIENGEAVRWVERLIV